MRLYQVEIHLLLSRTVIIKLKASYSKRLFIFPQQLPLNVFFLNLQGWSMSIRWVLNLTSRLNKHWFENSILGPATQLPEIMPSTHSRYNFNSITITHPFWWLFFYLRSWSVTLGSWFRVSSPGLCLCDCLLVKSVFKKVFTKCILEV